VSPSTKVFAPIRLIGWQPLVGRLFSLCLIQAIINDEQVLRVIGELLSLISRPSIGAVGMSPGQWNDVIYV